MIVFKPCEGWHLRLIKPQDSQVVDQNFHADGFDEISANSLALSCWVNDTCVGAAGIRPIWEGRAVAWAFLGRDAGPAMVAIAKKLRFVIATYPARRLELTVRANFEPGCRLAALLGFRAEARLLGFFPDGADADLFARIRGETEGQTYVHA